MQTVGVDEIGPCHGDVVSSDGEPRIDEASSVSIIGPEENALRIMGNDLHDKVGTSLQGAVWSELAGFSLGNC